ncbi:MAG: TetR/AcrR family transcriptional regulator [Lachnospiraceae bacterium]|nr:TetR/AcrR family transcriptional regulator [Lachnospiraceae bacterium]
MGEKSLQKKQHILTCAKKVFEEKGFKNVTMKDIVEACEISRGGLYLYFESTKEIFVEVLKLESQETDNMFEEALTEEPTAADILALFLKEQKREILSKKGLTMAIYEFYFAEKPPKKENFLRNQFNDAVRVIEKLIEEANASGEFLCDDPLGAARNIMYVLEGLKISAQTIGVSEATINQEILYIMKGLVADSE